MSDKVPQHTDAAEGDDLQVSPAASRATASNSSIGKVEMPHQIIALSDAPQHRPPNDDDSYLAPSVLPVEGLATTQAAGNTTVTVDLQPKKKQKRVDPIDFDYSSEEAVHLAYKSLMGGDEPTVMSPLDMLKGILLRFNVHSLKEFSKEKLGLDYPKNMNKPNAVHEISQHIVKAMTKGSQHDHPKENDVFENFE